MGYSSRDKRKDKRKSYSVNDSIKMNKLYLVPIVFILGVLPLIMYLKTYKTPLANYPWFSISDKYTDFFLYYKSVFLILTAIIMAILIVRKAIQDKQILKLTPVFIPLCVYVVLAIVSSLSSKYRSICLSGGHEHFESLLVVIAYCLVVYYVFLFVKTEDDIKLVLKGLLFCTLVMAILAVSQATGHDLISSDLGKRLIVPSKYWGNLDSMDFKFDKWVYLTLYNPNYVGSFVALVAPLVFVLLIFLRKVRIIPVYIISLIGLFIALIFSKSATGIIGLVAAGVIGLVLFWRYYKILIPAVVILIISIFLYNGLNHNIIFDKLNQITKIQKTEYNLTNIQTKDSEVVITYKHNDLHIQFLLDDSAINFSFLDQNGDQVLNTSDMPDGKLTYTLQDERFPGFVITPCIFNEVISFNVLIDNKEWFFTNQTDGNYYYINCYTKYDKIVTAPSAVFSGYESLATKRGYIWSRTIPLLKKHIILGSGADTFALEFPQQDYVMAYNSGYDAQFISKPHNMFLQMGVQSGVLSLIAFLIFYIMYFLSSLRLYINGRFDNYYSRVGVGILLGTFAYLVTGLANDSTITVAPIFWTLMGLGIAVNIKVKAMKEEVIAVDKTNH